MTATKPASKKHRRQDSPTMDVSATIKKTPPPTPPTPPSVNKKAVNKKVEKNECFHLEEYPEDIGQLIKQLAAQERVLKTKENAVLKWSKNLATAQKANETEKVQADTGKRQKDQDVATNPKEAKRQQEIKKWQKIKNTAAAKKKAKYTKDQAIWLEILQNAHSKKQITTAEKMLRELEANNKVPSKEMKKADKMLSQLAKDGPESSTTSDKKQGKKKLLRNKNGNVPSNEVKRAQKKLRQFEDELYLVKGHVAVTKKMIRLAAEEAGLKNIPTVDEEEEGPPAGVPTPSSFPEAAVEVENDEIDPAINDLVIEESPTNVTDANCNARLTSQCAPFSGALTHLLKNTKVCNPTACFE